MQKLRMPYSLSRYLLGSLTGLIVIALLASSNSVFAETLFDTEELFRTGKYAECITIADAEIQKGYHSQEWPLLKIRCEMLLGHYTEAAETVKKARVPHANSIRLLWLDRDVRRFNGNSDGAKEILAEIAAKIERLRWMYRDPDSLIIIGNFFLEIGVDAKQVRLEVFKQIQQAQPNFVESYLAGAELALAKNDYALAAEDFQKALKLDEHNPRILYGLSRAFESSDSEQAQQYLNRALEINPNHLPSLLFVAEKHLQAERYEETEQVLESILKINPAHPNAWALRAVLAHLESDVIKETFYREQALKHWRENPEIDSLIGQHLSQKYRFAEGAAAQRRALKFDAEYLPAKIQLSNDLLRLGDVEAGWKLAEEVFEQDNYNVVAYNLATLQDHMEKFRTLQGDGFIVRMDAREAEIYGDRVLELLNEARQVLCSKFNVELKETIAVEIFPRQQDFAIRTFGLPGGAGFLGVCFGNVITMNSPASQGNSPSNWEAVLWHEFCHVVTLSKTKNRMPRWLSEGISVYEERQRNPAWGQSITPAYREMILGEDLTPVSDLSGAFLRPPSGQHLMFAYYESSVVVEYIVETFGMNVLVAILDDLAKGLPINYAITRHMGPVEQVDERFAEYIRSRATDFGATADFSRDELPKQADSNGWKTWLEDHPDNYWGLQQYALALIREKNWEEARTPVNRLLELVPDYTGEGSPLLLEARISRELGETEREVAVLNQLAETNSDAVDVYRQLAEHYTKQEDWPAVIANANRILSVNPLQPEPYRILAEAGERSGDIEAAIHGLKTLTLMDPFDPADVHYRTARLYEKQGQLEEASKHVLYALSEAPRYREAHELLLLVIEQMSAKSLKKQEAAE